MSLKDTIFAPSSGSLPSGICVVRVSGAKSAQVIEGLCGSVPKARHAQLSVLRDSITGDTLDRGLVLWFPAPYSFTGEDMAEFHLHGSLAVLRRFSSVLSEHFALRPAESGEFTRRAFYHGKLDLTRVEATADLIAAQSESQRRQALDQLQGSLHRHYEDWRKRLIHVLALSESAIDFADDELPTSMAQDWHKHLNALMEDMARHVADGRGLMVREGLRATLSGASNVGKSSLLNALSQASRAIVSDELGTTRDVIESTLDIDGYTVQLFDGAGLRDKQGAIEREGTQRAMTSVRHSDMCLAVVAEDVDNAQSGLDGSLDVYRENHSDCSSFLVIINKIDKTDMGGRFVRDVQTWCKKHDLTAPCLVSAEKGTGLDDVRARLRQRLDNGGDAVGANAGESVVLTRLRHRGNVVACLRALREAEKEGFAGGEVSAECLRAALACLGRIIGTVDMEDVLDDIFSSFCIGK